MSWELQTWLVDTLIADSAITALVGADSAGTPAIFPYHHSDADEIIPYPHITFARFGSRAQHMPFDERPEWASLMDNPRIAVCVWSTQTIDECWPIYKLIDGILRGPAGASNAYFGAYTVKRTALRDDLYDEDVHAYHLHSEYCAVTQLTGTAQP